jgi:hypothetical protein
MPVGVVRVLFFSDEFDDVAAVTARVAVEYFLPEIDVQRRFGVTVKRAQGFPLITAAAVLDEVVGEDALEICRVFDRAKINAMSHQATPRVAASDEHPNNWEETVKRLWINRIAAGVE